MRKDDEFFELICITPENGNEFSLGHYSTQKIANEQKDICINQAEKNNLLLEYEVRKHRIIK